MAYPETQYIPDFGGWSANAEIWPDVLAKMMKDKVRKKKIISIIYKNNYNNYFDINNIKNMKLTM